MTTRRTFLLGMTATGALALLSAPAFADDITAQEATAITEVFGDGLRFVAVAVTYSGTIAASNLSVNDFKVGDRTVAAVYPANSTDPADMADTGNVVIIALSPDDADASLSIKLDTAAQPQTGNPGKGPGSAGDPNVSGNGWAEPEATVTQAHIALADGNAVPPQEIEATVVRNLIVDDFRQYVWNDPETGDTLPYNLFIPKDYDPAQTYPLVNFMHDAGATSKDVLMTLKQGLGAISFASPEDQARHACFVLAPQYAEIIADDASHTSSMLDTTINLIKALTEEYSINPTQLYTTGQSGGGMMSIAMNIKYPDFFAASFLVACQWDAALVTPMAGSRLFILVSQDDAKAFPGQNAITEALEATGARVARAEWDGTWDDNQYQFAFDDLMTKGAPVNYVSFAEGTVFEPGADTGGASGHRNTWRLAYSIPQIRNWLLQGAA